MTGLVNTTVDNFFVPADLPGKLILQINSTIVNPSDTSMEIGDMYFNILYQDQNIGQLYAPNVTLLVGSNILAMSGVISPQSAAGLSAVNDFFNRYQSGLNTIVNVQYVRNFAK